VIAVSAKPYKCQYPGCGKAFKHKSKRDRHEQNVHGPLNTNALIPIATSPSSGKEALHTILNTVITLTSPQGFHARIQNAGNPLNTKRVSTLTFETLTVMSDLFIDAGIPTVTNRSRVNTISTNTSDYSIKASDLMPAETATRPISDLQISGIIFRRTYAGVPGLLIIGVSL